MKFIFSAVIIFSTSTFASSGEFRGVIHQFQKATEVGFINNDSEILLKTNNYELQSVSMENFTVNWSMNFGFNEVSSFDPQGKYLVSSFIPAGNGYSFATWSLSEKKIIAEVKRIYTAQAKFKSWYLPENDKLITWRTEFYDQNDRFIWIESIDLRDVKTLEIEKVIYSKTEHARSFLDVAVDTQRGIITVLDMDRSVKVFKLGEEKPVLDIPMPDILAVDQYKEMDNTVLLVQCKDRVETFLVYDFTKQTVVKTLPGYKRKPKCELWNYWRDTPYLQSKSGHWIGRDTLIHTQTQLPIGQYNFDKAVLSQNERYILKDERDGKLSLIDLQQIPQIQTSTLGKVSKDYYSESDDKFYQFKDDQAYEWDLKTGLHLVDQAPGQMQFLTYSTTAGFAVLGLPIAPHKYSKLAVLDLKTEKIIKEVSVPYKNYFFSESSNAPNEKSFVYKLETYGKETEVYLWKLDSDSQPSLIFKDYYTDNLHLDRTGKPIFKTYYNRIDFLGVTKGSSYKSIEFQNLGSISVSIDSMKVAVFSSDKSEVAEIYDLNTGDLLQSISIKGMSLNFTKVGLSGDGKKLSLLDAYPKINTVDLETGDSGYLWNMDSQVIPPGIGFSISTFRDGKAILVTTPEKSVVLSLETPLWHSR